MAAGGGKEDGFPGYLETTIFTESDYGLHAIIIFQLWVCCTYKIKQGMIVQGLA